MVHMFLKVPLVICCTGERIKRIITIILSFHKGKVQSCHILSLPSSSSGLVWVIWSIVSFIATTNVVQVIHRMGTKAITFVASAVIWVVIVATALLRNTADCTHSFSLVKTSSQM